MPSPAKPEAHFLDTNAVIYALGRSPDASPATQRLEAACRRLVQVIGQGELQVVTSSVVLQELIYLLARWQRTGQGPALPPIQRVVGNVVALCQEVFTPTLAELQQAMQGYDPQRHDFNDRLIVRGMRAHGITWLLTADREFDRFSGIRRADPVALAESLG